MKRLRLLGLTLIAILTVGALTAAATATANPTILPTPTTEAPVEFSAEGGKATLTGPGGKIECEKFKILPKSAFTSSEKAKDVHIEFEGNCKNQLGNKCKTEGELSGTILVLTDVTLVDILPAGVLALGALFELLNNKLEVPVSGKGIIITCGVGNIEVIGSVIGEIKGPKTLVKTKTGELVVGEKEGKQAIKTCDELKEICSGKTFELKAKFAAEEALKEVVEKATATITLAKEVEFHF